MGLAVKQSGKNQRVSLISPFGCESDPSVHTGAELLGGKGEGLREMARIGLPVPAGFTIITPVCVEYRGKPKTTANRVRPQLRRGMSALKRELGHEPLVSVRSGGRDSMPGMLSTILNVGLTKESMPYWEKRIGKRTMLDCRRRLIQMFGNVVNGIPNEKFEKALTATREAASAKCDSHLSAAHLLGLCKVFETIYTNETGKPFPDTKEEQLFLATVAVFRSWNNPEAIYYRNMNAIPHEWGTAVNIQAMVFGNAGDDCSAGTLFTRDPATGENTLVGEWLPNAQGEDVVAGIRTPLPLSGMESGIQAALADLSEVLETHYGDVQDIEFTVEHGKLWVLQTRPAKRTAQAAFRIVRDMVDEGTLTRAQALARVTPEQFAELGKPMVVPAFGGEPVAAGIPGCPGIATGRPVFSSVDAVAARVAGESVILVTEEITVEDLPGLDAAVGALTKKGGTTCHAAVVMRSMNKPCVVGVADLDFSALNIAPVITIDGSTGRVWVGEIPVIGGSLTEAATEVLGWAYSAVGAIPKGPEVISDRQRVTALGWVNGQAPDAIEAVKKLTDRSGIVFDLTQIEEPRLEEDAVLWELFNEAEAFPYEVAYAAAQELVEAKLEGAVVYLTPIMRKGWWAPFKDAGYKVAVECETLADVLASTDYLTVTEGFIEGICGGPEAYAELTEVFAKAGRTFKPIPEGLEAHEVAAKVFGQGGG